MITVVTITIPMLGTNRIAAADRTTFWKVNRKSSPYAQKPLGRLISYLPGLIANRAMALWQKSVMLVDLVRQL